MKKIIASAGLIALGATGVDAAMDAAFVPNDGKIWSVSATLRGFYDDNYNIQPSKAKDADGNRLKRDSYGFEISPKGMIHFSNDQTDVGAQYIYSHRYYEDREKNRADNSHQVDAWLKHRFNEKNSLLVTDSFVIAQEPELIDPNFSTPTRANGDNIRNNGAVSFIAGLTERLGLGLGYQNNFYDYKNDLNSSEVAGFSAGSPASRSGLLDRIEHLANLDLRWKIQPQTTALLGYQFGWSDYNGDEPIAIDPTDGTTPLQSDVRNSRSHYAYVGVEHNMTDTWSAGVRLGGRYTDYYNTPDNETSFSPYANLLTRYTYLPGSYVELGFRHDRNATDVISTTPTGDNRVTTDQESSSVYATLNHRITPKLTGNLLGQLQHSTFNGGAADNAKDDFFIAGVNLTYRFNHYFSAEAGYNYDRLDSDSSSRSFTRNRAYVGITATY